MDLTLLTTWLFHNHSTIRDSTIIVDEVVVHGKKIPMTEIRKEMFKDHNPYMRLWSEDSFEKLTREELTDELYD